MIGRLRELAERPIADDERRRLFAAVALLIVLAAVLLSVTGEPSSSYIGASEQSPSAPTVVQPAPSRTTEDEALRSVELAARRFLNGYLAYLYGRGNAAQIESADPALERRLGREVPRVSPATRRRQPRLAELDARRVAVDRYLVVATIADGGVAEYPIELTVARAGGGGGGGEWLVTSTAAD